MEKEQDRTNDNEQYDLDFILPTPIRSPRKCERYNYVPYKEGVVDRNYWHDAYISQLIDMYDIVKETMDERYPKKKINWNNPNIFHNLSRLIYHCSCKYITPYLN